MGIEPTWLAWKARALPLSYARTVKQETLMSCPSIISTSGLPAKFIPGSLENYLETRVAFQEYAQGRAGIVDSRLRGNDESCGSTVLS